MNTTIKFYTEKDMYNKEKELKQNGYKKIAECMWVKIYKKEDIEISLSREY